MAQARALVIPVERLSPALLKWIESIPRGEFETIVVVDDGGGAPELDAALRARGIVIVRHAAPVGRGAAIRSGMHAALATNPALGAIVVASESDSPDDILKIAERTDALVLSARAGDKANGALQALAGIRASNPWAKLRSIPVKLIPHLLTLESRGLEFDLQTVVVAAEHAVPVIEISTATAAPARPTFRPLAQFLAAARPARANTRLLAAFCSAVFAAVLGLTVYGFATGHLFEQQFLWMPWGLHRLTHFAALFTGWSAPILLMVPWIYGTAFAALLTGATILAEGPLAVAAVLFFLFSANSLGSLCARRMPGKSRTPALEIIYTLFGIGIYALLMTLTARTPVNYPAAWGAVLAAPILLDLRGAAGRLRATFAALRSIELPNWSERSAFALLLFVLTIQWFVALGPESSADGMTMHLAITADIAAHHAMTFRPESFVWSVMPMAADFSYSIVYLLGGEASASLLNFAMFAMLAALVYTATRYWLARGAALVVATLFASTPLVNLVTGSLFIENFVAVMVLGALFEVWQYRETGEPRALYLAAALAGTAGSAKFGALAFVLVLVVIAGFEARRRVALRRASAAAVLLLLFAAPPYVIAYAKTRNPIFPFLNKRFPSPLLEHGIEFSNQFTQPLTWKTPFEITFHTKQYLEGLNGAIGFQYLLLIPLAAVALFASRSYGARIAAAVALFAGAIVFASQPYARYVYPAMPLLSIAFAALLARFTPRHRRLYLGLVGSAVFCIPLNAYFTPTSGWYHKDLYSPAIFHRGGRERIIAQDIPLRDVTIRFRRAHPKDHVLLLVEQDLADAGSSAYEYHWHQWGIWKQIAPAGTASELRRIFARLGVRYFISRHPGPDDDLLAPWSLAEFLSNCTTPILENGRFYAAQITPACETISDAALEAGLGTLPPALVSPGIYDDFDLALRFHGAWTRSKAFDGPYRHSISYTQSAGAEVEFAFEGTSLTYVFTKTFNRGIALLEIDGAPHEIDQYAPATAWQTRQEFAGLAPGRHVAILRATGRKSEASVGPYIDLDAFIAR